MHFIRKRGDWILGSVVAAVLIVCITLVWLDQTGGATRSSRAAQAPPRPRHAEPQIPDVKPPPLPEGVAVSPDISAEQVVRTIVTALANNDDPNPDTGIAVAFAFASPGNKTQTGPFGKFQQIVRAPAYLPMLRATDFEFGPMVQRGIEARQPVKITYDGDKAAAYLFILSKQQADDQYKNCWMTDGVMLLGGSDNAPTPSTPREVPPTDELI